MILLLVSPMVPLHVAPTPANALHLLRSSWCGKLVGAALAAHTNRFIFSEIADVLVHSHSAAAVGRSVRQDLIAALAHQRVGSGARRDPRGHEACETIQKEHTGFE